MSFTAAMTSTAGEASTSQQTPHDAAGAVTAVPDASTPRSIHSQDWVQNMINGGRIVFNSHGEDPGFTKLAGEGRGSSLGVCTRILLQCSAAPGTCA